MPEVIARAVGPKLRELGGEPPPGRPMQSEEEAVHDPCGHELEPTEKRELFRAEEIRPPRVGALRGRKRGLHGNPIPTFSE
jgi:hypothetical protein